MAAKSSPSSAATSGSAPSMSVPAAPSIVIMSPSRTTTSPTVIVRAASSIFALSTPATQGLPMPRATTAACEVMPPCEVTTPCAWMRPWMSSGVVSQRTSTTASPAAPRLAAVSASKTAAPTAAPGEAPSPRAIGSRLDGRVQARVQQLVELGRVDAQHGLVGRDHALGHELAHDPQRGLRRALGGARLQHVEPALLDRELDVLHLAVMLLEALDRRHELVVGLGQQLAHALDRLGRADAGDHVLALGVLQELAVEPVLARRGIAREADAGARALAAVAEHHLADVRGRAEVVGDVVRAAVDVRARRAPGAEDGRDREPQLLARILRELRRRSPRRRAA